MRELEFQRASRAGVVDNRERHLLSIARRPHARQRDVSLDRLGRRLAHLDRASFEPALGDAKRAIAAGIVRVSGAIGGGFDARARDAGEGGDARERERERERGDATRAMRRRDARARCDGARHDVPRGDVSRARERTVTRARAREDGDARRWDDEERFW